MHLNDLGELRLESTEIIYAYPTEWFDQVHVGLYRQWIERHRKCISTQCAYFEKTDVETLIEIWHIRGAFQKYAEKSHNFTSAASILLKFMDILP